MKKNLLLMILMCLLAGTGYAAVVSGTMTFSNAGIPAPNRKIYLVDSSGGSIIYRDSAFTSSTGTYSFAIPGTITSGYMQVYSYACNSYFPTQSGYLTFSGSNLTLNLTLGCTSPHLSGNVYFTSGGIPFNGSVPASYRKVYIKDTSVATGTLILYDSVLTDASGNYSYDLPTNQFSGYIQAYMNGCGGVYGSGYLAFTGTSWNYNIPLPCSGPYVIDSVFNSTSGAPVFGQMVVVMDSSATFIHRDSAYTDASGYVKIPIHSVVQPGHTLSVYTVSCGVRLSNSIAYTGGYIVAPTFHVCASNHTVSGTVTNIYTSLPMANQVIAFVDSSSGGLLWKDTATTNASGVYSFNVPAFLTSGKYIVSTLGCGTVTSNQTTFTTSNVTLNLAICSTSTATINGTLHNLSNFSIIAGAKVYLYDTSFTTTVTKLIDSAVTNTSGYYSFTIAPTYTNAWFWVKTASCANSTAATLANYTGSSITVSLNACAPGADTISGHITTGSGATPMAGVLVRVTGPTTLTAVTNSAGYYSIPVPASWPVTSFSWKDSAACGNHTIAYAVYAGSNKVINDTLCPYLSYSIGGIVRMSGTMAPAVGAKVYLIGEQLDTTVIPADTLLIAYDSTLTNSSGIYSFTSINGYWGNTQRIKAMLLPSHPNYSNYLPSYHDSALMWRNAQTFSGTAWLYNYTGLDVMLKAGSNPGGPGFIGGSVILGANKNVGDPLEGKLLLLTKANGDAVGYTWSDAAGQFSFGNLAYGSYLLFGDIWGKSNPPLAITLAAGTDSVKNVVFEENSHSFDGHIGNLSVFSSAALESVRLYPNPATDHIMLKGVSGIKGDKTVIISDVRGATVHTTGISGNGAPIVSTEGLRPGIYMLRLITEGGTANFRFIKE